MNLIFFHTVGGVVSTTSSPVWRWPSSVVTITWFPPGYSFVLSLGVRCGVDAIVFARWLDVVLLIGWTATGKASLWMDRLR